MTETNRIEYKRELTSEIYLSGRIGTIVSNSHTIYNFVEKVLMNCS